MLELILTLKYTGVNDSFDRIFQLSACPYIPMYVNKFKIV